MSHELAQTLALSAAALFLAACNDVALRYLQQIEHAAASPSLRRLVALSHALDVDVADLIAPGPVMPRRNPGRPRQRG